MADLYSFDSATGKRLWEGISADKHTINNAIENALDAFQEWSNTLLHERIDYLHSYRDELEEEKENLSFLISQETGKPLWEAHSEVESMIAKIPITITAYQNRCPNSTFPQATQVVKTFHKPHGITAVLGPFNFPGHLPNGHIVPAILSGNTVIFKPSELTPATGEAMVQIWHRSGLPEGVLNLVQGGKETGSFLVEHPKVNAIFFTGSWETGKWLCERFAPHPEKLLALEMGGNNPLIVEPVSNLKAAAYLIIQSAFLTAGQRCSCARRLIIKEGKHGDDQLNILIEMMQKILVGFYNETPQPFMGPVINDQAAEKIIKKYEHLIQLGGKPLVPLQQLKTSLLSPGIIDMNAVANPPDEEIFGPLLQIYRYKSFEDAIEKANHTSYGLCAGLISDQPENFDAFYRKVRAGIINWNTPTTGGSSLAPFGGIGKSGNFRPSGYYAVDYCSYPVASSESYPLQLPGKILPGITL